MLTTWLGHLLAGSKVNVTACSVYPPSAWISRTMACDTTADATAAAPRYTSNRRVPSARRTRPPGLAGLLRLAGLVGLAEC